MHHLTPLASPAAEVIENPGAHGSAVTVGARHADVARPAREQVAARRAHVGAVGLLRVDLLVHGILLLPGHLRSEAKRFHVQIGETVNTTPEGKKLGVPSVVDTAA